METRSATLAGRRATGDPVYANETARSSPTAGRRVDDEVDCSAAASTACRGRVRRLAEASISPNTRAGLVSGRSAASLLGSDGRPLDEDATGKRVDGGRRGVLPGRPRGRAEPRPGNGRPRVLVAGYRGPLGFLAVQFSDSD